MKKLMTVALLAAFALPVVTVPAFGKDTTKKTKKAKKVKAKKATAPK